MESSHKICPDVFLYPMIYSSVVALVTYSFKKEYRKVMTGIHVKFYSPSKLCCYNFLKADHRAPFCRILHYTLAWIFFSKTHRATVISSMSICPLQRPFCNRQSSQSPLREFYSKDFFSTIFKVAVSLLTNCIFQKACPIVWELTYLLPSSLFPVESCSAPFLVLLEAWSN